MDLLQAQTIKDRYMDKMTLKMTGKKIDILGDAIMACLILGETLSKRNIANKIPDDSMREEMKSSIFRVIKKMGQIKAADPDIESVVGVDTKASLQTTYGAFTALLDEKIGCTVEKYQNIVDLITQQKAKDEQELRDRYDQKILELEERIGVLKRHKSP